MKAEEAGGLSVGEKQRRSSHTLEHSGGGKRWFPPANGVQQYAALSKQSFLATDVRSFVQVKLVKGHGT